MSLRAPSVALLGDLYIGPYGGGAANRFVGSSSVLRLTHNKTQLDQKNYGKDGGLIASFDRLESIDLTLSLDTLQRENLAAALRGLATQVAAGSVTAENAIAYKSGFIPLARIGATNVVVKNQAGTTTYVANTDYTVAAQGTGIYILNAGAITDGQQIQIAYNFPVQDNVEAAAGTRSFFTIFLDGINEAEGNAPVRFKGNKLMIPMADTLDLISDGYAKLDLTGKLLRDETVTAVGLSKFYSLTMLSATGPVAG